MFLDMSYVFHNCYIQTSYSNHIIYMMEHRSDTVQSIVKTT